MPSNDEVSGAQRVFRMRSPSADIVFPTLVTAATTLLAAVVGVFSGVVIADRNQTTEAKLQEEAHAFQMRDNTQAMRTQVYSDFIAAAEAIPPLATEMYWCARVAHHQHRELYNSPYLENPRWLLHNHHCRELFASLQGVYSELSVTIAAVLVYGSNEAYTHAVSMQRELHRKVDLAESLALDLDYGRDHYRESRDAFIGTICVELSPVTRNACSNEVPSRIDGALRVQSPASAGHSG
jgi:hypothetical protein